MNRIGQNIMFKTSLKASDTHSSFFYNVRKCENKISWSSDHMHCFLFPIKISLY